MENNNKIDNFNDLRAGDIVAFEYSGNTAIVMLSDNCGYFDRAVGLWFDSNLVGEKDAIWYSDYLDNIPFDEISGLRYASDTEKLRYYTVVYLDLVHDNISLNHDIAKLHKKIRSITQICKGYE